MKLKATKDITVSDKAYTMTFNMNTMAEIEEMFDVNLMTGAKEFFETMTISKFRGLLKALLYKHNLSLEDVGELMGDADFETLLKSVVELFSLDSDGSKGSKKSYPTKA